jgi:hypothetical protein
MPNHGKTLLERVAWWMDEAFRIPGTNIRVGWDPIIDLIPGAGDAVTTAIQAIAFIVTAFEHPELAALARL